MTSNFNLAKSIYLSQEEIAGLLGELKPAKFAFTVLHCLVGVPQQPGNNNNNNKSSTRIGIICGFSSLQQQQQNQNNNSNITPVLLQSHLSNNNTSYAEADVALVVDFGDTKETVRLSSLQPKSIQMAQNDHGLFIQRFSVSSSMGNRTVLPEPEQIVEIRNRIEQSTSSTTTSSSFASWKILDEEALKNKLSGMRRQREPEASETENQNARNNNSELSRFQDHRVSRLQGQLAEQLSALSQSRNDVRTLQNEVQRLQQQIASSGNKNNNNNSQQQQQQQDQNNNNSSTTSTSQQQQMITKLSTVVTSLTQKVSQLNKQIDEVACAGAAKFNVEPTIEAVLEALNKP